MKQLFQSWLKPTLRYALGAAGAAALTAAFVPQLTAQKVEEDKSEQDELSFLKVTEETGSKLMLEVGIQRFEMADGNGPEVALVSVAHIGDAALYETLQERLDTFDVVLYESVKPAGAASPGGKTHEDRVESTRASMRFIASLLELQRERDGAYPTSAEELLTALDDTDPRLSQWAELAMVDAWGQQLVFSLDEGTNAYALQSLGADGKVGGEGANIDLALADDEQQVTAMSLSSEDGLQSQLADALDLEFQLDTIDYDRPNWICSDMTMDQVEREFRARGIDFGGVSGSLAGTSFPAKMIKLVLQLMKAADAFFDGAMADMMKVMMIELLGDESITEHALNEQMGEGFSEVIVEERNKVVMEDLQVIIDHDPQVKSVGIFYGAAHMPDFTERLTEMGYVPTTVEWVPAMTVDLKKSALTANDIANFRRMMKMSMRRMMR